MIYEYLLAMISKATGGSSKQLARTLLSYEKTMEDYIWEPCFVRRWLSARFSHTSFWLFCPPLQFGYLHREVLLCLNCRPSLTYRKTSRLNNAASQQVCYNKRLSWESVRKKKPRCWEGRKWFVWSSFPLHQWMALTERDYRWHSVNAWLRAAMSVI